ncbi:hypothetical protein EVAR_90976_1 [Eumeta japonica]|uniref:Craniofacial development protein 2 n=1 Tax=Eumeta variegata TaxID=151549 RepID=A0A4C1Z0T4_EUMVA|nr:hypothetical protein EVAR_90976_1 [Eumeta japonica]
MEKIDNSEGPGIARESFPGPGGGDKFLYRGIGNFRLDCGDEVHHPSRLIPRRSETKTGEVRFGILNMCGGMDDKIDDVCQLMKDMRLDILCVNEIKRNGSGRATKRGFFCIYWSGVDQHQRGCRGVGFTLLERLFKFVSGYECTPDTSKLLEERKEFWTDVRDILMKCDRNERIVILDNFNGWVGVQQDGYEKVLVRKIASKKKKAWLDLLSAKANDKVQRKDSLKDKLKDAESVRQRCVASPWLFNLLMDSCLYDVKEYECGLRMNEPFVKCLLYADDQGKSTTEYDILTEGEKGELVKEFVYLGTLFTNKKMRDIERRVNVENKVNGALIAIMNYNSVSQQARLVIHNGMLIPALMYGSDSWVWQKINQSRINAVEMRSLRSMCKVYRKDRCRNSDVKERWGLKEDVVT